MKSRWGLPSGSFNLATLNGGSLRSEKTETPLKYLKGGNLRQKVVMQMMGLLRSQRGDDAVTLDMTRVLYNDGF